MNADLVTPDYRRMFEDVCEERDFSVRCIRVKDSELIRFGQEKYQLRRQLTQTEKLIAKLKLLLTDAGVAHGL